MIYFSDFSSGGGTPFELDDLFASGEIGDVWRFDSANMSLSGSTILSATGLANGLVLATGGGSPQLNTISGNGSALFDGSGDFLAHDLGSAISQPGTIILSTDVIPSGGVGRILAGSDNLTRWQASLDSSDRLLGFAGSTLLSGRSVPVSMEKSVLTFEFNGASTNIRQNGHLLITGDAGSNTTDFFTVGGWGDGTSSYNGSIYAAMFIDRLLSTGADGELDRAERLLASWGGNSWPTGWWDTMFNGGALSSNSGGWNGFTWRIRLPAASLTDVSGSLVRLGLQAGTTETLTITKAYIGLESGGNFRYGSAPTQLTWDGGSTSVTIPANNQKMTDAASLALDGTATVVVSLYMNGGTSSDTFRFTSTMNGLTTQFKGAADEAALVGALSGYTAQNSAHPIARLVVD